MGLSDTLDALTDGINGLKATVFDAEAANVKPQTLQNLVELSVLRASSLVEEFLRDLFYRSMLGQSDQYGVAPILSVASEEEVDLIVYSFGSRREKFLDWIPYEYTLDRAAALLVNGLPFTRITNRPVERRALLELGALRNAVAHPSDHAQKKFLELAQQRRYPVSRPGEYLLSTRGGEEEVLLLLTRLEVTCRGLASPTDVNADAILEPEDPFRPDQRCLPGRYECTGCGAEKILSSELVVGPCPSCSTVSECHACGRRTATSPAWRRTFS